MSAEDFDEVKVMDQKAKNVIIQPNQRGRTRWRSGLLLCQLLLDVEHMSLRQYLL